MSPIKPEMIDSFEDYTKPVTFFKFPKELIQVDSCSMQQRQITDAESRVPQLLNGFS